MLLPGMLTNLVKHDHFLDGLGVIDLPQKRQHCSSLSLDPTITKWHPLFLFAGVLETDEILIMKKTTFPGFNKPADVGTVDWLGRFF